MEDHTLANKLMHDLTENYKSVSKKFIDAAEHNCGFETLRLMHIEMETLERIILLIAQMKDAE